MKYFINEDRLGDLIREKITAYRTESGKRFSEYNNYTKVLDDLTIEEQILLNKYYANETTFEDLPVEFQTKVTAMVEEIQLIESKIKSGEFTAHLFTEEEIRNYLNFTDNDYKFILDGKEEESIPKS